MPDNNEIAYIQQQIAAAMGGASSSAGSFSSSSGSGRVYMGTTKQSGYGAYKPKTASPSGLFGQTGTAASTAEAMAEQAKRLKNPKASVKVDNWKSTEEATQEIYGWGDDKLAQFRNALVLAGYKGDQMNRADLISAWGELVGTAAGYGSKGRKLSPWDLLASEAGKASTQPTGSGSASSYMTDPSTGQQIYIGPRETSSMTRDVNYSDPNTARAIVNKTMQGLLGRDPTNNEVKSFTDALHAQEAANPLITQTTESFGDTGQSTGVSQTTTGGFSSAAAGQMAEDAAKSNAEYGSVQAATTYMDALRSLVYGG